MAAPSAGWSRYPARRRPRPRGARSRRRLARLPSPPTRELRTLARVGRTRDRDRGPVEAPVRADASQVPVLLIPVRRRGRGAPVLGRVDARRAGRLRDLVAVPRLLQVAVDLDRHLVTEQHEASVERPAHDAASTSSASRRARAAPALSYTSTSSEHGAR